MTTEQYSAKYVASLKATIARVFRARHTGTGVGKKVGFRHAREMIQSQIRHLAIHREFHANPNSFN
jgi:hypothetical protein